MPVRIILAYRHPTIFHALMTVIEKQGFSALGEPWNARDVYKLAQRLQLGTAVLNFEWPIGNGNGHKNGPQPIAFTPGATGILMTVHTEQSYILESLQMGAKGYILNNCMASFVPHPGSHLTDREMQVVRLIADGNSTKEVAARLGISVKTAESHRTNAMDKLNVHETASLVRSAIRLGLVQP
jgi:DNA-binding NarL/FixJ family response regulator